MAVSDKDTVAERMRLANPKYVLREYMLVTAYSKAAAGDMSELENLYELVQHPYDEGAEEESSDYYRRAPDEVLLEAGTAFMS